MFITFEGPEGGGKTTQIARLRLHLEAQGKAVIQTREPGAGALGPEIRRLLLESNYVDGRTELLLFLADRSQHVATVIEPALANGSVVICDRFVDSTVVYQGYGRGFELEWLRTLNRFATGGRMPDRTYLLDLDPAIGLARQEHQDRLDREPLEFHRQIRAGFLAEADRFPERYRLIDASQPPEAVFAQIQADFP